MRFKLDENFGTRTQILFRNWGHEVQTVRTQGLQGTSDSHLYQICRAEGHCLVTLDLDFADTTRFPPADTNGVAVVRSPHNPSLRLLEHLVHQFLRALSEMPIEGRLWVVEPSRIRVYQPESNG